MCIVQNYVLIYVFDSINIYVSFRAKKRYTVTNNKSIRDLNPSLFYTLHDYVVISKPTSDQLHNIIMNNVLYSTMLHTSRRIVQNSFKTFS